MRRLAAGVALGLAGLMAVPAVAADHTITAGPAPNTYEGSPAHDNVTIDQGDTITFKNDDNFMHDVTSDPKDVGSHQYAAGELFKSETIQGGKSAAVKGVEFLTPGDYDFHCSVHPFMHGTLTVTSAGRPATRPAGDSRAPGVAVDILSRRLRSIARSGRLRVSFHTDEDATVELRGRVRARRRTFALRRATRT